MTKWVVAVLMAGCMLGLNPANAQQERTGPRREFPGEPGERVMGTVASVGVDLPELEHPRKVRTA